MPSHLKIRARSIPDRLLVHPKGRTVASDRSLRANAVRALIDHVLPCRVVATANITLSGTQTIDGVAVVAGDRVLVAGQSTASQNGIYVCASGAWKRSKDTIISGLHVIVRVGTTYSASLWICSNATDPVVGTDAITWEQLGTVGGTGTTNRIAKWTSATTLGDSPFISATGTVALGGDLTVEPTDSYLHIDVGQTSAFSALKLTSLYTTNDTAALIVESDSRAGGALITQTAAVTPAAAAGIVPALTLVNTTAYGFCLDIAPTDAAQTESRGARITMPATSGGIGLEITDNGAGGAIRTTGTVHILLPSGSTTKKPLYVQARTTSTVPAVDVDAGQAQGLRIQRASGASPISAALIDATANDDEPILLATQGLTASGPTISLVHGGTGALIIGANGGTGRLLDLTRTSATATTEGARIELDDAADTGTALRVLSAGTGTVAHVTTSGNGKVIEAATSGTGRVVDLSTSSTGTVLHATASGNAQLGYFYRNVASASANGLTAHLDHASDAGNALVVTHDGNGALLVASLTNASATVGTAAYITSAATGATNALYVDSAGTAPTLYAINTSTGDAIQSAGKIRTVNFRMTATTPAAGKVMQSADSDGNGEWQYVEDVTCLTSIYEGDQTLGNIALVALDVPVQIPFDLANLNPPVCNDQWDSSTNFGAFTPTANLDRSGLTTNGVVQITARFIAQWPAGATASDLTLWIRKNNAYYEIDCTRYANSGQKVVLEGTFNDVFTGTDTYRIYLSQNVAGPPIITFTTWHARVETAFQHTNECCSA
jgi:hypothetical protein